MQNTRILAIELLLILVAGLLSTPQAFAATKVRIGYFGTTCEAPLFAAYEKGFWQREGLDVELVRGDHNTLKEALATGKVDATDGLLMQWLKPVEQGLDVKFTAGIHTGCIQVLVPVNSPIKSVRDLRGKTIGVPAIGGGPMNLLTRLLTTRGINARTGVSWKAFPASELELALGKGEVDLISLPDPLAQIIINHGKARSILNTATDKPFRDEYCCLVVVSGRLVRQHPDVARAITQGWMNAAQWVNTHQLEIANIEVDKKYVPGDAALNAKILATYNYRPSIIGGQKAVALASKQSKEGGILDASTDPNALAKSVFVWLHGLKEVR